MKKICYFLTMLMVLIGALLLPLAAYAQNVEYVGSTLWSGVNDVKVAGNYAYCAFVNGLVTLDVTNPTTPVFISKLRLEGNALKIDVAGNYAYVAEGDSCLKIINVSNPASPALTGIYHLPEAANSVFIAGNYAYVADASSGLIVVNISDPSNPVLTSNYAAIAYDVFVLGNYAYLANRYNGLTVVDITDPVNPLYVGRYYTPHPPASVFVSGGYAYVIWHQHNYYPYESGLCVISVADPANPVLAGSYNPDNQDFSHVFISGNYAYVLWSDFSDSRGNVDIVSLADLSDPVLLGCYYSQGISSSIYASGGYIYLPDDCSGLLIINIADPINPALASNYGSGAVSDIIVNNNYAYVVDESFVLNDSVLKIIDISNPTIPVPAGNYIDTTIGLIGDFFIRGDYAYVLNNSGGPFSRQYSLDIIDVSNPSNPTLIGSFVRPMGYFGDCVFVSGNYAYISRTQPEFMNPTYLDILDVSNPDSAFVVGACNIPSFSTGLFVSGSNLYQSFDHPGGGGGGFSIISVEDPTYPEVFARYDSLIFPQAVSVSGNYAYIADWSSGLRIFNIADPYSPILTSTFDTPGLAKGIFVSGTYAYVANADSGVQIIVISDPVNPMSVGSYDTPGKSRNVYVSGDHVYVADISSLQILRFTQTGIEEGDRLPTNFLLSQNYPNPFNAQTTIQYSLPKQSMVSIDIFDILGRRIQTLAEGMKPAGDHQAIWDASGQSSGAYFYIIKAGDKVETKKMVLMK
jgi:hypothetical protein